MKWQRNLVQRVRRGYTDDDLRNYDTWLPQFVARSLKDYKKLTLKEGRSVPVHVDNIIAHLQAVGAFAADKRRVAMKHLADLVDTFKS